MSVKVAATGDSLFCAAFPEEYGKIRGGLDGFISACDVRITNLETNLSDFGGYACQYSGGTWLNTRKELFSHLATFGFNFFGTANNHCMDYSYEGMLSTVDFLEGKGLAHAGTGRSLEDAERPAVIQTGGGRVAVIAVDASMEPPSMAGRPSKIFRARPGVNYLRHRSVYRVSPEELAELRSIAASSGVNLIRDGEIAAGSLPPDADGVFCFGGLMFTSDPSMPLSSCDGKDLARLTRCVAGAKEENSIVIVTVHCHDEEGSDPSDPPEYLRQFCRAMIDAGAGAVFGGGVHSLRGMELYRDRPVFYSLGDFIYQGMRVEYLPPDFLEKYGLDPDASAKEGLDARSKGGKIGLQTDEKNYLSVVPRITFGKDRITGLEILPVKLGFGTGNGMLEGLPYAAAGREGRKIFERFSGLSARLGTGMYYDRGIIRVRGLGGGIAEGTGGSD